MALAFYEFFEPVILHTKRWAFCLALLFFFSLTNAAHAEPISALIAGKVAGLVIAAGGGLGAASTAGLAAFAVANAVIASSLTAGLGMAANALLGRGSGGVSQPDFKQRAQRITGNFVGTTEYIPVLYGRSKTGGVKVYQDTVDTNICMVFLVSEGEIEEVETVIIDGVDVSDSKFTNLVEWHYLTGKEVQAFDTPAGFINFFPGLSLDRHQFPGFAAVAIRFVHNRDIFPSIPRVTFIVKGRKLYDPRDSSTAYSDNPALCLYDYLRGHTVNGHRYFGMGLDASRVDEESIKALANHCDELVDNSSGSTQKRYSFGGFVDTERTHLRNITEMLTSCNGRIFYTGGKFVLQAMKAETAAFDVDETNIIRMESLTIQGLRYKANREEVQFFNPNKDWQPDIAAVESLPFRTEDGGQLNENRIDLPFTTNRDTAYQLARIALNQSRLDKRLNFIATQIAFQWAVGDVINVSYQLFGYNAAKFRITQLQLNQDATVTISAEEYDPDVYSLEELQPEDLGNVSNFNIPANPSVPGAPAVTEEIYSTREGAGVKALARMSWAASSDPYPATYEAEYKLSTDTDWIPLGRSALTQATVPDIAPGFYNFRVRAINALGFASAYIVTNKEIVGLGATPADLTSLSLTALGKLAQLTWDQSVDLDVRQGGVIEFRHTTKTVGATWSDGRTIGKAIPGIATTAILPLIAGTYMAKAIDSSGKESNNPANVVSNGFDFGSLTLEGTATEHPGFSGTKSDMQLNGSLLELNQTGSVLSGTYEFANAVDAGTVKTLSCVFDIDFSTVNETDLFDSDELFDSAEFFDGDSPQGGDIQTFIRTTDDDPNGPSPTWSAWQEFSFGDLSARGVQGRIEAAVENSQLNVQISSLTLKAYS